MDLAASLNIKSNLIKAFHSDTFFENCSMSTHKYVWWYGHTLGSKLMPLF